MNDVFLGEIRYFAFDFAPQGWAVCAGQTLPIQQNTALFSLLGVNYGGDGRTTFKLPDFRGRVATGQGQGPGLSDYSLGQESGTEFVTLSASQIPVHGHAVAAASATGTTNDPTQGVFAKPKALRGGNLYAPAGGSTAVAGAIAPTGGGLPHENRTPGLVLTACIALVGIYPQRP